MNGRVALERPIYLTREGGQFRLSFGYRPDLVEKVKNLPYARFDPDSKTWTAEVCEQTVLELRDWFAGEGLTDVYVDTLLQPGEKIVAAPEAVLRAGNGVKRPYLVQMARRNEHLYTRLRSVPGAQWEQKAQAMSYPATAAVALSELVSRGVLADPQKLLSPAAITVAFDGRTGTFRVLGDPRADQAFTKHFPQRDVVAEWRDKGFDVAFGDAFTEEVYRGEIARHGGGIQPDGLLVNLFEYQKKNVAVAVERSGTGVFDVPGLGKCCLPGTLVAVNGNLVEIERLWEDHAGGNVLHDGEGEWATPAGPLGVCSLDENHTQVRGEIFALYRQHVCETVKTVTLDDGTVIRLTGRHPLLSETDGWTNQFKEGDRVAVPRRISHDAPEADADLAFLLAWQIGAGHENPEGTCVITPKDESVLVELQESFARYQQRHELSFSLDIRRPDGRAAYLDVGCGWSRHLRDLGYDWGHRCAGKRIPGFLMDAGEETARILLRNLHAAKGHVAPAVAEFDTASRVLAGQIRLLLRRFGVSGHSSPSLKAATNGKPSKGRHHRVVICGDQLRHYATEVGFNDTGTQETLTAQNYDGNPNHRTLGGTSKLAELRHRGNLPLEELGLRRSSIDTLRAATTGERRRAHVERVHISSGSHGSNRWGAATLPASERLDLDLVAEDVTHLEQDLTEDVRWAKVISLSEEPYEGYVYDLSVRDHHNFLAEGVYCHNTATGIAWALELLNRGVASRAVIVVPGAVKTQWAREITRFTGHEDITVVDGDKKKREKLYAEARASRWLILNYDLLHLDFKQIGPLVSGALLIADEAHRVKTYDTKRSKAMRQLAGRAARRLALTGTPIENNPGEFYSVMSGFVVPGVFGNPIDFLNRYQYPNRWGGYEGARNLGELRNRARPHFVRHTKAEVATHLPPLRVQHVGIDPDPAYAAALKRAHREARKEIAEAATARASRRSTLDADARDEIETGAEMTAVGMLRLMCLSPRLVVESDAAAANALCESGLVPEVDGPKLDYLRGLAVDMQAAGERLVCFTFSKRMIQLIAERFDADGVTYVTYTGDTNTAERDKAVKAFTTEASEENPGPTVFLATDAGAEGLNLGKCCSTLINLDIPWTPGRFEQRSNRIHRIDGTSPSYLVMNTTLRGTLEEGILRMVEQKADLVDAIFGEKGGRRRTTGRGGRNIFEEALKNWEG